MKKLIKALSASLLVLATSDAFAGDWHLAYSHDEQGNALEGSFEELKKDLLNGASIRILLNGTAQINPDLCKVVRSTPDVISCQKTLNSSSDTGLYKSVIGVNLFTTEGKRLIHTYDTKGEFLNELNLTASLKWYTDK